VWIILAALTAAAIVVSTGASFVESLLIGIVLGVMGGLLLTSLD
jgi:hypothetical protein